MKARLLLLLASGMLALAVAVLPAGAQGPQVRAVLFHSPTCPHCHEVMTRDLPPLMKEYGDQLQLMSVDVSTEFGRELYRSAVDALDIPAPRQGVPTVILGDEVLVGSVEIPERLPGLIEAGLARGGTAWPDIPGLTAILASSGVPEGEQKTTALGRLARDPLGNGLAVVVLTAMVAAVGIGVRRWHSGAARGMSRSATGRSGLSRWYLPLLLIGLAAASYLALTELTWAVPFCGPVGDCRAVQSSGYAHLLGMPVALLGVLGYAAMLGGLALGRVTRSPLAEYGQLGLTGAAFLGSAFSIYLTFLEPFVIGATCMWCLTSALAVSLLFMLSAGPARHAYERTFRRGRVGGL